MKEFTYDQRVYWFCDAKTTRSLLGELSKFEKRVPGRVLHVAEKRVRIAVYDLNKDQIVYRSVSLKNLSSRASYFPAIDDASLEQQGGTFHD